MAQDADTFADRLARARAGDQAALLDLARQYESAVRIAARVHLGPALRPYLDSLDLVQSVHKSILVGLRHDKFDVTSPERLLALALLMVRRKVARRWRHLKRQQRLDGAGADPAALPHLLASLTSTEADPAQAAQRADALEHVCRQLDATERRILELRLQGYSSPEVARDVGEAANVVRVRLSRLRQRLQAEGVLADWL